MAGLSSRSLPWRRRGPDAAPRAATQPTTTRPVGHPVESGSVAVADPEVLAPAEGPTTGTSSSAAGHELLGGVGTAEPTRPTRHTPSWRDATPLLLVRATHPGVGFATALVMTVAAALADRPGRELGLVLVTVLVGQAILGWFNDLVDRRRDDRHRRSGKPVADGRLGVGTVTYALVVALLLLVPLSVANGLEAAGCYLLSVSAGVLGNLWPRRNLLSWVPWAVSFALLPGFLSYGGWGGDFDGRPPSVLMTVLAAMLGVGVHVLVALWGLLIDHEDGWRTLPLRLGRRFGTQRLLVLTCVYLGAVTALLALVGATGGLSR